MENEPKKTHYRKVFKSDHLGVADLEELNESNREMVFTIVQVKQEIGVRVAGKKGDYNIAYFKENIKPFVLNAGNSKIVRDFAGGSVFVEDWVGIKVRLYINADVVFGGEKTGGVRIDPNPVRQKPPITKDTPKRWKSAKAARLRDGNFNSVLQRGDISQEDMALMEAELVSEGSAAREEANV